MSHLPRVIRAVRRANLALDRMRKHSRSLADAQRAGDTAASIRAAVLLHRAEVDFELAQRDMKFPWEVQAI